MGNEREISFTNCKRVKNCGGQNIKIRWKVGERRIQPLVSNRQTEPITDRPTKKASVL